MKKTTTICDVCCETIDTLNDPMIYVDDLDICHPCCESIIRKFIKSRKDKPLRSNCPKCKGTGKVRVKDEYATDSMATCGENRIQYKTVKCQECKAF